MTAPTSDNQTKPCNTTMNPTSPRMMRPDELPFDIPESLAEDVLKYIDAYERDDWQLEMYIEILHQSANVLNSHDRLWLLDYYTNSGWEEGMEYHDYA